jgi:hypothetical protein
LGVSSKSFYLDPSLMSIVKQDTIYGNSIQSLI